MSKRMFPVELLAMIAGYVQHDLPSLQAFALTSKDCHEASQSFIFYGITIRNDYGFDSFRELLTRIPKIAYWTRRLRLFCSCPVYDQSWLPSVAALVSAKLKNINEFILHGFSKFGQYAQVDFFEKIAAFSAVTSLSLVLCTLRADVLNQFMQSFPQLSELYIEAVKLEELDDTQPGQGEDDARRIPACAQMPPLTTFHFPYSDRVNFTPLSCFGTWLADAEPRPALRTLCMHLGCDEDAKDAGRLIERVGGSLQHLELLFSKWDRPGDGGYKAITSHISLADCGELRIVRFGDPSHHAARILLRQVASPHLHRVHFTLAFTQMRGFGKKPAFTQLDALLAGEAFAALEEVCFTYDGPLGGAKNEEKIRAKLSHVFPTLTKRGVLKFKMAK